VLACKNPERPCYESCCVADLNHQIKWNWSWPCRNYPAYHHRRCNLPTRPREAQHTVLCRILRISHGQYFSPCRNSCANLSLKVGPIVSGPMAENLGWRSFWWLNAGLLGFTVICCIFLFPETKYHRPYVPAQSMVSGSPGLKSASAEEVENSSPQQHLGASAKDHADPEKAAPVQSNSRVTASNLDHALTHEDPWLGRGSPSKQQWKLIQPYEGNFLMELWMPWKLFAFPIVQFSSFVVSWTASSFLTLNLTQSQAFAVPPYNFSSAKIGFFNFAILIGAFIGLFTAGPLSDFIAARLTRRNNGIREPEMRLLTMIPYVIIMIIGNVVTAIGYEKGWDWKVTSKPR